MPRRSAVSITTFGPSTWQVMTSAPWSTSALVASASLHRHRPLAGEDHLGRDRRVDRARAEREGVDVQQHLRDRLGGDEAELLRLAHVAGDDAVEILRPCRCSRNRSRCSSGACPSATARRNGGTGRPGISCRHPQHVRVEIAERSREQQRRAVELDHALPWSSATSMVSGTFSSSTQLDARASSSSSAAPSAWAWL